MLPLQEHLQLNLEGIIQAMEGKKIVRVHSFISLLHLQGFSTANRCSW